ncbi:EAL domain-containing protein [Piscinibacter sakaiensis]|uniref:EAL domain-containing protein n=1 Tax=Piscinibacter sakaiensis TaxID=1547922 RepID=UPI003AAB348D
MSLIRQIRLLLLLTLVLAFLGSMGLTIQSARTTLSTQLQLKNNDNAILLAQVLGQQQGDLELMELVITAQFDTGFYRSIRFIALDGQPSIARIAEQKPLVAPGWFVRWLPIDAAPGLAQVSDGWRALGAVEVTSQTAYAYDDLWRASVGSVAVLGLLGLLVAILSRHVVRRIRKPLDRTVEQAQALVDGRFITIPEPHVPELKRLAQAMNTMVMRLKSMFEAQAKQLEALREQAYIDPVSRVANRQHFIGQLNAARQSDYADPEGGLVLLRLLELAELNRQLGRSSTDQLIAAVSDGLQTWSDRVKGCHVGRLNGSDFALYLPVGGQAFETAQAIADSMRKILPIFGEQVSVAIGAVEILPDHGLRQVLAAADSALAGAECRGGFAVELADNGAAKPGAAALRGEGAWRENLLAALTGARARLVRFPVIDAEQQLIHLECPLRLQLEIDGDYEPAAAWLPLALRSRLTAGIDELAVRLALDEISTRGQPLCVNLSPASLQDSGFAARLRGLLTQRPAQARLLSLEVNETAAVEQFELVQELSAQLRPLGIRLGLEHAGQRLARIERLFEAGLDYVKLDAAVIHGIDSDNARAGFLRSLVLMLHGLSIQVIAEGVGTKAEAAAAWQAGVDGQTGAWASALRADLVG